MNRPGTPIAWPLRVWLVVEVLFSVGAILTIALDPANTRDRFAWNVEPVVMAAVLGAYYVSAALVTLLPVFARRWEMIRVMMLPTILFTALELLATLLHWSQFSVGSAGFTIWFLSYLLPPPILLAGYLWHERRVRQQGGAVPQDPLSPDVRRALIHIGGLTTLLSFLLFILPRAFIAYAPWQVTPLSVRVFAGFLLAAGALMLSMARENDRARVLVGVPFLILMFPVVTLQIVRFPAGVDFANTALFLIYGIMLMAFALGVYLARGDWRQVFR
jgi:hypothetical protein